MFRCNVKRPSLHALLVVLLCLCTSLQTTARLTPLQGKEISISVKKSSLSNILNQISKKSGITIYFVDNDLAAYTNIDYDAKDKQVVSILEDLFKGKDLRFEVISEKQIGVRKSSKKDGFIFAPADTLSVSGRVTDEKGIAIVGATVKVKNSNQGTTTNSSGHFLIANVSRSTSLIISNVSYLTEEININGRRDLGKISLKEYIASLDEMQIIAYGVTTKRTSTSNTSTVRAADIGKSPISNPILAVAGRIPGIQISQSSGFAGGGVRILVQGPNSLFQGVNPFYVVDGVPYLQQLLPNFGSILGASGQSTSGNPLSFINPADIESIDVLKDADATAIYGSRAANGAIIITTKKGKEGRLKVDVNFQSGFSQVPRELKLLNTQDYLAMRKEAIANDNGSIGPSDYDLNGTWDTTAYTNWQKQLIGKKAHFTEAHIGLSGGTSDVRYLVAGTFHEESTVFPTALKDRKTVLKLNLNGTSRDKRFHFSLDASYLYDNNKLPQTDITSYATQLAPNNPSLKNPDGSLSWGTNVLGQSTIFPHPLSSLTSVYISKTGNLLSNLSLNYRILDGLSAKANLGYTNLQIDEVATSPSTQYAPEYRATFVRTARYGENQVNSWIVEPQLSYEKAVGQGMLSVLAGMTIQQNNNKRNEVLGTGYSSDFVLENIGAASSVSIPPGSTIQSVYKYNAGFARINYDWQHKYILNLSARRDGSSRFGPQNRFHNFGAIGGAWIFSNEIWIPKSSGFSFGKIRASYGTTGNDQIGDYTYFSLYNNFNPPVAYRGGAALLPTRLTNPYLQWEETKKLSIGLDLGFISDKILFNGTFYQNRSSNLLATTPLPRTSGPGTLLNNFPATVQNCGWEFSVNTVNLARSSFRWSTNFNLTIPRNKLISFPGLETSTYSNMFVIGESIGIVKTYHMIGVNSLTGVYQYVDKNGHITDDPASDPSNAIDIMNPDQKYYGGLANTISYKGIQLDFLFQFVRQKGRNFPTAIPGQIINNQPAYVLERWQKPGDVKPVQRFSTTDFNAMIAFYNLFASDAVWEDASFVRLKNASLSWTLPEAWTKKANIQSARFFVQGQNLLTITNYRGLDPETGSSVVLPPLRVVTLGVNMIL